MESQLISKNVLDFYTNAYFNFSRYAGCALTLCMLKSQILLSYFGNLKAAPHGFLVTGIRICWWVSPFLFGLHSFQNVM